MVDRIHVKHQLLGWSSSFILLIAPLIHGSRMIMLIYYILGIHTKIIVVDRPHIVVHLRFLRNNHFSIPLSQFLEFCSKFLENVYGFHNLLDHTLWTYTIYHPLPTIRYSKLCIDNFYHYKGLCKLGSQFLKGASSMEECLPYQQEVGGSISPCPNDIIIFIKNN